MCGSQLLPRPRNMRIGIPSKQALESCLNHRGFDLLAVGLIVATVTAAAVMIAGKAASLNEPVFLVCERNGGGSFNEPLNLMSCAVFFIAAWLLWRDYQQTREGHDEERVILVLLITLVGVTSAGFHIAALRFALYEELAAVTLFIAVAGYITFRRELGLAAKPAVACLALLAVLAALADCVPGAYRFNGSAAWLPVVAVMAFLAWTLSRRGHFMATGFLAATGILAAGVIFRFLDPALCRPLPMGTYFVWRLCEGMAFYQVAWALRQRRSAAVT